MPDPTIEENEKMATDCEGFCEKFPVLFPQKNITRKMAELSLVLPKFIRSSPGLLYKILALEQGGEGLHNKFNILGTKSLKHYYFTF